MWFNSTNIHAYTLGGVASCLVFAKNFVMFTLVFNIILAQLLIPVKIFLNVYRLNVYFAVLSHTNMM